MSNLLPPAAKKQVYTEYVMRVGVVSLYLLSGMALVAAGLTVPGIALMQTKLASVAEHYTDSQVAEVSFTEAEQTIADINSFVDDVATMYNHEPLVPFMQSVLALRTADITLASVRVTRDDAFVPEEVVVSGEALTRTSLQLFAAKLEALPVVESVALPIENLAKEREVPFLLTLTLVNQSDT